METWTGKDQIGIGRLSIVPSNQPTGESSANNHNDLSLMNDPYCGPILSNPFIGEVMSGVEGNNGVRSPGVFAPPRSRSTMLVSQEKISSMKHMVCKRKIADPRIMAEVVMRLARFLLWLSSYRSVSSTISSEIISSMMSNHDIADISYVAPITRERLTDLQEWLHRSHPRQCLAYDWLIIDVLFLFG